MTWDDAASPGALAAALASRNVEEGRALVAALLTDLRSTARLVPAEVATSVLTTLRAHLWFEPLEAVAQALEAGGQEDPRVRRQLAQARIELPGGATRAIAGLRTLERELGEALATPGLDASKRETLEWELGECLGLLGRAYKQLYIDALPNPSEPRTHDLEQSRACYGKAFAERWGDYLWHGINDVALRTHAERVRRGKSNVYPAVEQAESILAQLREIESRGALEPWDLAKRAEAYLASGRFPEALAAIEAYLGAEGLSAFHIRSTQRQFEQLYLLDPDSPPGATILPMMTARRAQVGGGVEPIDVSPAQGRRFERVLGDVAYKPLAWLKLGVERAQCVARLGPSVVEGFGTGFLFDGAHLGEKHTGRHLLLTNAHVCSPDADVQRRPPWPADPKSLVASFLAARGDGAPVGIGVRETLFSSPPDALDATLVELAGPPPDGALPPPLAAAPPPAEGPDARVNVIGHPKGLDVRVSMQDNAVVEHSDPYLRYRAPTDPGSSGSPVFSQSWELVALHHAGDDKANEGVLLEPLLAAMRKALA